jgi:hypothetical protein
MNILSRFFSIGLQYHLATLSYTSNLGEVSEHLGMENRRWIVTGIPRRTSSILSGPKLGFDQKTGKYTQVSVDNFFSFTRSSDDFSVWIHDGRMTPCMIGRIQVSRRRAHGYIDLVVYSPCAREKLPVKGPRTSSQSLATVIVR